jgi:hypothetical protein
MTLKTIQELQIIPDSNQLTQSFFGYCLSSYNITHLIAVLHSAKCQMFSHITSI